VERHNQTVNLFKEEIPGAVQTAVVACTEIIDSSMLVEAAAAGTVWCHKLRGSRLSITFVYFLIFRKWTVTRVGFLAHSVMSRK
jgi:hypothetical protein